MNVAAGININASCSLSSCADRFRGHYLTHKYISPLAGFHWTIADTQKNYPSPLADISIIQSHDCNNSNQCGKGQLCQQNTISKGGLSGAFDVELTHCEDADTGEPLGWPPAPLRLHGSFDRLPLGAGAER